MSYLLYLHLEEIRNAIRTNRTATRTMTTTKSTVIVLLEVDLTPNENLKKHLR
jgi:hypothetical protein